MPDEAVKIDINDLSLVGEEQEINVEASAYDAPPPIPDGKYRVRLKLAESGILFKKTREKKDDSGNVISEPRPYYEVNLEVRTLHDNETLNNKVLFDNPNTLVSDFNHTSRVASLVKLLGGVLEPRMTDVQLVRMLNDLLMKEPEGLEAITQWQWYFKEAKAGKGETIKGMKKAKQRPNGSYEPVMENQGEFVAAKAKIVRYTSSK